MASVTQHVDLPASPDRVWTALTDFANHGTWMVGHVGLPDGPPTLLVAKTTFKETVEVMGMKNDVSWTIAECDAPRRLALAGKGPMGAKLKSIYDLEPTDNGTRLQVESGVGGAAVAAMAGALAKEAGKSMTRSLEQLKSRLEEEA